MLILQISILLALKKLAFSQGKKCKDMWTKKKMIIILNVHTFLKGKNKGNSA